MRLPMTVGDFRIIADPDLRFAPSGVAVAKVRAVATSKKKVNEEWVDDKSCWVNLVAFKQQAENVAESLRKGDLVSVVGRTETEDWEDKDGNKRTSVNLVVDSISPSLQFNTVSVNRTERGSNKTERAVTRSQGQTTGNPWESSAPVAQDDEPPF